MNPKETVTVDSLIDFLLTQPKDQLVRIGVITAEGLQIFPAVRVRQWDNSRAVVIWGG